MLKNILVTYDSSEASRRAFRLALELARPVRATVTLFSAVRVCEREAVRLVPETQKIETEFDEFRCLAIAFGVSLRTSIVAGYSSDMAQIEEIVARRAAVGKADLVLVGYPRRSGLLECICRPPERAILKGTKCAVLFVK